MRLRPLPSLAIALAVLAGLAAPASAAPDGFLAAEVRLPRGGLLDGTLVALQVTGGREAEATTFVAEGRMTLESDQDTYSPGITSFGGNPLQPPASSSSSEDLGQAQAFLVLPPTGIGGTYSLLVRPAPGSQVEALARVDDARLTVPDEASFDHPKSVSGAARPELGVPAAGSHHVDLDGTLVLKVTGDLFISLYDLDLTVADSRGARTYRSGTVPHEGNVAAPSAPNLPPASAGSYDDRQLYLRIRDGHLSLRVDGSAIARLYMQADEGTTPGPVELAAAVPSGKAAAPANQVRPGPAALEMEAPRDGLLPVRIAALSPAELEERLAHADPRPGSTAAGGWSPRDARLAVGGLAAAVLALAAWAAWLSRRRALARMQMLFGAGRYDEAEHAAARLLARAPSGEAALVRAVSLLRLQRADEVPALLEGRAARRVDGATRDFLWACARALQGRPADAARHLARCLAADPGYRGEALANPWLHALVPATPGGEGKAGRRGRTAA